MRFHNPATTIKRWDLATCENAQAIRGNDHGMKMKACSADLALIASVDDDTIDIWEVVAGRDCKTLHHLASGTPYGHTRIWHVATGEEVYANNLSKIKMLSLKFATPDKLLALGLSHREKGSRDTVIVTDIPLKRALLLGVPIQVQTCILAMTAPN